MKPPSVYRAPPPELREIIRVDRSGIFTRIGNALVRSILQFLEHPSVSGAMTGAIATSTDNAKALEIVNRLIASLPKDPRE